MNHTFKKVLSLGLTATMILGISTTALASEQATNLVDEFVISDSANYDNMHWFSDGLAVMTQEIDGEIKFGYMDIEGTMVIPAIYDDAVSFYEGLAEVTIGDKSGYINTKGDTVVPIIYDYVWMFMDGFATVINDDHYGIVNTKGEVIVPLIYDYVESSSDGLFMVATYNEYATLDNFGFLNTNGDVIIPLIYNNAYSFYDGLAAVEKDTYWGVIDTNGDVVIPFIYGYAESFIEGFMLVEKDGKWGFIDTSGNAAIPIIYDDVIRLPNNYVAATTDGIPVILSLSEVNEVPETTPNTPSGIVTPTNSKVVVNGTETVFDAYTISGSNYFKLRDICALLNVGITWDNDTSTIGIDTSVGYAE